MDEKSKKIKIAWLHTYDTFKNPTAGVFMYDFYDAMKSFSDTLQIDVIHIGNISNPFNFIRKYFSIRKFAYKYEIIHAQYGSGTGFFTSLLPGKKVISLRGSDWYKSPSFELKSKIHISLGNVLTRLSLKKFESVIVMSERMKFEVNRIFQAKKVFVLPDGVDLKKFFPVKRKSKEKFRVLFSSINKVNPGKRYHLARSGFNLFNKKHSDSELVFMCGLPHSEVNASINNSDVILLTSTHEGWPNIIKEGLACNVPFVSTDVSDLKEIADKTRSCFICKDNIKSISEALEQVYFQKTQEDLRSHVLKFSYKEISQRLKYYYKSIVSIPQEK